MSTNKHIKLLSDEMFSKKDIYDSTGYVMEGRSHRTINSKDDSIMENISSYNNISK